MKKLIACLLVGCFLLTACGNPNPNQPQWGQGQETSQGYQQPDHGWFYYFLLYHLLFQNVQPTYHPYYPPAGYPKSYRPWHEPPRVVSPQALPQGAQSPYRNGGGFSSAPSPSQPSSSYKSGGGFSAPRPSAPSPSYKSGGGFSSPSPSRSYSSPSISSSPRSSGGFSSGSRK